MRGTITAPSPADDDAAVPRKASVTLAVAITDLDALRADPCHTATVSGHVRVARLTGADTLDLLVLTGIVRRAR